MSSRFEKFPPFLREPYGVRAGYINVYDEPLPIEAIDTVIPNSQAKSILPKEFWSLVSPEVLLALATHTVAAPPHYRMKKPVANAVSEGRSNTVALAEKFIQYGKGVHATRITSKGGGPSGRIYPDHRKLVAAIESSWDPIGYFGLSDALTDMETSMWLLEKNMRVALPLGCISLKINDTADFVKKHWPADVAKGLISSMERVDENGDRLALYLRLGGPTLRLHDMYDYERTSLVNNLAAKADFQEGANLLLAESLTAGLTGHNDTEIHIRRIFQRIISGKPFIEREVPSVCKAIGLLLLREVESFIRAACQHGYPNNLLKYPGGVAKDVGPGLIFQDFEGKTTPQDSEWIRQAAQIWVASVKISFVMYVLHFYFDQLVTFGFVDANVPKEELMFETNSWLEKQI